MQLISIHSGILPASLRRIAAVVTMGLLAVLTFAVGPTLAHERGPAGASPAWTIRAVVLSPAAQIIVSPRPGVAANQLAAEKRVWVLRCDAIWCEIQAGSRRGWVELSALSFGQFPRGPLTGPKLMQKRGGPGEVCFYSGTHFSGAKFCAGTGYVIRDMQLSPWNNRIGSISITGNQSVLVCRDRSFGSYCETVIGSRKVLPRLLKRSISSLHVY